jgi:hypothetical protein
MEGIVCKREVLMKEAVRLLEVAEASERRGRVLAESLLDVLLGTLRLRENVKEEPAGEDEYRRLWHRYEDVVKVVGKVGDVQAVTCGWFSVEERVARVGDVLDRTLQLHMEECVLKRKQ